MGFKHRHLLGLEYLERAEIEEILDQARAMKKSFQQSRRKKAPALLGRQVVCLFFENSTRTRMSFEIAAKRLSADVATFASSASSLKKGETMLDTARNIEAMGSDIMIVRHNCPGTAHTLAEHLNSAIINAGDGCHEHPTQGLLDIFTIWEKKGTIEGLNVAIIGDLSHSRVMRSNLWGLLKLGARVTLVGPKTLMPSRLKEIDPDRITICHDLRDGIRDADVINILRIQRERQQEGLFPSIREYKLMYGINEKSIKFAKPGALVMHPGPVNRGVELSDAIADGEQSLILEQVSNGVAVRMAVLYMLSHNLPKFEMN